MYIYTAKRDVFRAETGSVVLDFNWCRVEIIKLQSVRQYLLNSNPKKANLSSFRSLRPMAIRKWRGESLGNKERKVLCSKSKVTDIWIEILVSNGSIRNHELYKSKGKTSQPMCTNEIETLCQRCERGFLTSFWKAKARENMNTSLWSNSFFVPSLTKEDES
jgi:hypothetical protein